MKIGRTENYSKQVPMSKSDFLGNKNEKKGDKFKKIGIATVSIASTVLPILAIRKHQGKCLNKDVFQKLPIAEKGKALWKSLSVDYGFKEMMFVGLSSILGGVTGGVIFDKEASPKDKVKEGVHKAFALSVPAALVAAGCTISKKAKVKMPIGEIASVIFGVGAGMPIANKISNSLNKKIFNEKDSYEKRGIKADDYLMHVDDVVGAMVLARVPFVNTIQLDKILAAIYAHEGYEAGIASGKNEK